MTNQAPATGKLWIGLAAVFFLSFVAASWLGREVPGRKDQVIPSGNAEPRSGQRDKRGKTADPMPRAEDQKKLLRFFVLMGLARK